MVDGTFAFISDRALAELKKNGAFTYDGILWQRIDDSADDSIIHVKAPATGTEMWIDAESPLPLVLELRNNPFGIEWRVKTPPSLPKGEESQVAGRNGTTSYTQGWMSMSSVCSIMSMSVGKSLVSKSPVMQRVVSEAVSCTPYRRPISRNASLMGVFSKWKAGGCWVLGDGCWVVGVERGVMVAM